MKDDLSILARTLYGEAEANDRDDAEAIACVIMNRVKMKNWPNTVAGVCLQPWQFSCWNPGDKGRGRMEKASGPWWRTCQQIAEKAIAGELSEHPCAFGNLRATHYYAEYIKPPKWAKGRKPVYENGGRIRHFFFNDVDTPPPKTAKEALDQQRPISRSREIGGSVAAGVGTAGGVIADTLGEAADSLSYVAQYADTIKWIFIALTLAGVGFAIWARLKARKDGER